MLGIRWGGALGAVLLVAVAGCGDDDGARPDAGVPGADAARTDAASAGADAGGAMVDGGGARDSGGGGPCMVPADCQDGIFCNGYEACAPGTTGADLRGCVAGTSPCPGACDEKGNACEAGACAAPCTARSCDDLNRCNGVETCGADGACVAGMPVLCIAGMHCLGDGTCGCRTSADCDDGRFCNGAEACVDGDCLPAIGPCGLRTCDETMDRCNCATLADCTDGIYCNGVEYCATMAGTCATLPVTCTGTCLEALDRCGATCGSDADCSDGRTCNGMEVCFRGECTAPRTCLVDADDDGFASIETGGTDCDDMDVMRSPGRTEICDTMNRDEDCNPATFGVRDGDLDGFADARCCNASGPGTLTCGNDCDDTRPSSSPTSVEACNGINDDCDSLIDEGVTVTEYRDRDGDGGGDGDCMEDHCPGVAGWAPRSNDCDDVRASIREGSSACDPHGAGVLTCTGGAWMMAACPAGTSCRPQPDGTGLCI